MAAEAAGLSFAGGALAMYAFSAAKRTIQETAKMFSGTGLKEDHPTILSQRHVFCGQIVSPNTTDYEAQVAKLLPSVHLVIQQPWPFLLFLPRTVADVQRAIFFCQDFERENRRLPKTVFQYGWSIVPLLRADMIAETAGLEKRKINGCVVDLREMRSVLVDIETKTCWVESGARVKDLDMAAEAYGLCSASGPFSKLSIHHLVTAGDCFGLQTNRLGLLMDSLLEAEVVLASGEIRRCSSTSPDSDLFWVIKGGGLVPGCMVRYKFQLFDRPAKTVLRATMLFPIRLMENVLRACDTSQGHEFTYSMAIVSHPYVVSVTVCSIHAIFFCSASRAREIFRGIANMAGEGPISGNEPDMIIQEAILPKSNWWLDELIPQDAFLAAESFCLPDSTLTSVTTFLNKAIMSKPPFVIVTLDHVRGNAFLHPNNESVWLKRKSLFSGRFLCSFTKAKMDSGEAQSELSTFRSYCRSVLAQTLDLRMPSLSYGIKHEYTTISNVYGPGVGERVEQVELKYDPHRFFGQ